MTQTGVTDGNAKLPALLRRQFTPHFHSAPEEFQIALPSFDPERLARALRSILAALFGPINVAQIT